MSFKKHVKDLCMAPTEEEYSRIMIALRFICGEGNLLTWLEWWNAWKYHLIPEFQGFNIPGVNLADIDQSALRNNHPMMLIDMAYFRCGLHVHSETSDTRHLKITGSMVVVMGQTRERQLKAAEGPKKEGVNLCREASWALSGTRNR